MKILQQLYDLKQKYPKEWDMVDLINETDSFCAKCYGLLYLNSGGDWYLDILECDNCKTKREINYSETKGDDELEYIELYNHIITKQ